MRSKTLYIAALILAIVSVVGIARAYMGDAPKVVVEGNYIEAQEQVLGGEEVLGGTSHTNGSYSIGGDLTVGDDASIAGDMSITGFTTVDEFTQGGGFNTISTTTGTTVLTSSDLADYNVLNIMVNTGATATITMPASSTWTTLIPNAGDSRSWLIRNATSSTMALTIAAGTGMDLMAYTTNDDVIDQTEVAQFTCYRDSDTDVICITTEILNAD